MKIDPNEATAELLCLSELHTALFVTELIHMF